jgi:mRNA interferase YafQ
MNRKIKSTKQFKKDLKRVAKRNKNIDELNGVVDMLASDTELPMSNRDHKLTGLGNKRECHIHPDWLLIYEKIENYLILHRTGSHSDLY